MLERMMFKLGVTTVSLLILMIIVGVPFLLLGYPWPIFILGVIAAFSSLAFAVLTIYFAWTE